METSNSKARGATKSTAKPLTVTLSPANSAALRVMNGGLSATTQKRFEAWAVNQAVTNYCAQDEFPKDEFIAFAKAAMPK